MADPIESGTGEPVEPTEPVESGTQVTEPTEPAATVGEPAKAAAPAEPESFINPADLPEELKPHWKRMHGAYTKKMQGFADTARKAELVDRFYADPAYAKQVIAEMSQRLGMGAGAPAQPSPPPSTVAGNGAPPELIEAVKAKLPAEVQWMAEGMAAGFWAANQMALKPLLDERKAEKTSQRQSAYDEQSEELSQTVPGWEAHEETMNELLDYLRSDALTSKKFGPKLKLLYNLATGNVAAMKEVQTRMTRAVQSRTSTGTSGRSTVPDIKERIRAAKPGEKWNVAAEASIEELAKSGIVVR